MRRQAPADHGQRQPALMAVETADVVVIGTGFAPAAGLGQLSFHTTPETQRGWDASDAAMKTVVEKDGLARHLFWKGTSNVQSAHPLASCRMGDDPATSALDDRHELRTPLNAILGYASLMREGVGGSVNDEQSGFLDRVLGSTRHLNTLIDDILFFVQLEADRVLVRSERVRTERLLDQVLAMIPGLPEPEHVQVRIDVDPRVASMQVDGDLVRRVLFHLVGNALKFTSRGEVLITVSPGEGDAATITVRDTGVGIEPERLQQVFDLFAQGDSSTTRRYNGLGIGLTLVARCVRLLGGEVTARSEPGVGSEFRVFLPGVLGDAGPAEGRPRFLH